MPYPYSEADALAYATRVGMRIETARTALGLRPQGASAKAPVSAPKEEAARVYAAKHGLTVWQAVKALHVAANSPHAQASEAAAFARLHGVSFLVAYKALGFDAGTSGLAARVQRYAIEHGVCSADAAKAIGRE